MCLYGVEIRIIDRRGAQTMLYLICTMISSVHLAHYGVSRTKDWVSVDCGTTEKALTRHYFELVYRTSLVRCYFEVLYRTSLIRRYFEVVYRTPVTRRYFENVYRSSLVVVVELLFYVHGKHLRSCRDGQLT